MSTKLTLTGGAIILVAGMALAAYASTNGPALTQAKARTVNKYLGLSQAALAKADRKGAEKFALKALQSDPENKAALAGLKKVILASCPAQTAAAHPTAASQPKPAGTVQSKPAKPAQPAAEDDEEMGCI